MHELSLCRRIISMIEETAREDSFTVVKSIHLSIGKLSCIEAEALRFGFESLSKNSIAQGASLELTHTPASARCMACNEIIEVEQYAQNCPLCSHQYLQLISGDEMRITQLEVA